MLSRKAGRVFGVGLGIASIVALLVGSVCLPVAGYRVIEEMEQYVSGQKATIKGRPTWKQGTTIHVYIPNDPEGKGAEQEVQAACKALEEKLRSETNANLTFEYHVGEAAPQVENPPPYVVEVHWSDEETTDEPGSASPVTDIEPTGNPNEYRRTSEVKRGDIYINRNQGGRPYALNSIYNIALHEFAHILGLDHKTPDQDSVVMDPTGVDDPEKKLPVKDDDSRGLQDLYGRNPDSGVPAEPPEEEDDEDEGGEPAGTECCTFECGGAFGCAMVSSKFECDMLNGTLAPGTCEGTSEAEQDQGVYGRCNGGVDPFCEECRSDLGRSHYVAAPGAIPPGSQVSFSLVVANDGEMLTRFLVTVRESPWLSDPTIELSTGFAPGSEPFDAPPAVKSCIAPEEEVTVTYSATLSDEVPPGEAVTSTLILEDVIQRESYVYVASVYSSEEDYTSDIPEDVQDCARELAWASGSRHRTHSDERWSVRENVPREMCDVCGAPMCVVCMEYDLESYDWRPGVKSSQRSCVRKVENYLRTATDEETEILAAIYWTSYWDGRHNRDRP
ncbi:MAG: matrixin family metalloprotease [Candidatus Bipolaricaulia bacterium]